MAFPPRSNEQRLDEASIVIDPQYPVEHAPLLQVICDAYIEFGRLAVIAALLGLTSFIVTYVIKNQSLTDGIVTEPLALEGSDATQ